MMRVPTDPARRAPVVVGLVVAVPLLLIALVAAGWLAGMHLFVVQSPSMGTAAPVGALVVDAPLGDRPIAVGDVVTYRPPTSGEAPITHRVVGVDAAGITTQGDINGIADAWTTPPDRVVGRPVAIVPGLGWLVRAGPFVVAGLLPVLLLSRLLRSPVHRTATRMLGASVVVASVVMWLRPLLNASVLTTGVAAGRVHAEVVSTGLLPIRVSSGGVSVHLATGQVGTLLLPPSVTGRYSIATALDIGPVGWLLLAAVCVVPMLWTVAAGPIGDRPLVRPSPPSSR